MKLLVTYFSASTSLGLGLLFGLLGAPTIFVVLLVPIAFVVILVMVNLMVSLEIQDEINRQRADAVEDYKSDGLAKKIMYKVVKQL
jgi:uncharacterized integral membrane protein